MNNLNQLKLANKQLGVLIITHRLIHLFTVILLGILISAQIQFLLDGTLSLPIFGGWRNNQSTRDSQTCQNTHSLLELLCISSRGHSFTSRFYVVVILMMHECKRPQLAIRDMDLQNNAQIGLQEVTATTLMDARQMEHRAQSDTPLDGSTVGDGKTRHDSLSKVMFAEHQKKALRAACGDDSADECYGSDSDNDELG
ncbi:hypothetical protein L7F22_005385 [Adiantum nelumboides]|nr:hypothetical protein [Adiantum nelumboides]